MTLDLYTAMYLLDDLNNIENFIKQHKNDKDTCIEYFVKNSENILTNLNIDKNSYHGFISSHARNFLFKKDIFNSMCSMYNQSNTKNVFFKEISLYDKFSLFIHEWENKREGEINFQLLFNNDYKNSRYKTKLNLVYNLVHNSISIKALIDITPYTTLISDYSEYPDESEKYSKIISENITKAVKLEADDISKILFNNINNTYIVNQENLNNISKLILKMSDDKFVINELSRIKISSGRKLHNYALDHLKKEQESYRTNYFFDSDEDKIHIESFNSFYNLCFNNDYNKWLRKHDIQNKFLVLDNKEFVLIQIRPEFLSLSKKQSRNYFLFKDTADLTGNYKIINEDDVHIGNLPIQAEPNELFLSIQEIIGEDFIKHLKNNHIWINDYDKYINSFSNSLHFFNKEIRLHSTGVNELNFNDMINDNLNVIYTLKNKIIYEGNVNFENGDFNEIVSKIESNIINNMVLPKETNKNKKRI